MQLPRECLTYHTHYLVRYKIIPLVRSKSSPPRTNDRIPPPLVIDRHKKNKKRYRGGLAHVVSSMLYSEQNVLQSVAPLPTDTNQTYTLV